ncbi:spermidine synthase [Brevibacillus choshinensis]|uniref:spermidine synthase n=1 Tax=Brevibacillus choshinensis TaxID=54911 RepID=UPI002E248D0C|nr:spermidine synthase [Brevibacillus choshinensis]
MMELLWIATGVVSTLIFVGLFWVYRHFEGDGSLREYVSEDEEPEGKYRILRKVQTPTQRVALVEHEDKLLVYSNGYVMFGTTEDEDMYGEAMIHIPVSIAEKRERVLLIGAGGGITTREVLRYPDVKEITVIDIDPVMIEFGKTLEPLVKFNQGSLNHPKVRTVVEDGRDFLERNEEKWDVIILDVPEPTMESLGLNRLYSWEFYHLLKERLNPGGVVGIACSVLSNTPEYYWTIQATLKSAGFSVLPYHFDVIVEHEEDWGYCVAATRPISPADVNILVPNRYLNRDRLKDMFHIRYGYWKYWEEDEIQTDRNRVLAYIQNEDI